jgi:hypothetical protein
LPLIKIVKDLFLSLIDIFKQKLDQNETELKERKYWHIPLLMGPNDIANRH